MLELRCHLLHGNDQRATCPRELVLHEVGLFPRGDNRSRAFNQAPLTRATRPLGPTRGDEQLDARIPAQVLLSVLKEASGNEESFAVQAQLAHVVTPCGHHMRPVGTAESRWSRTPSLRAPHGHPDQDSYRFPLFVDGVPRVYPRPWVAKPPIVRQSCLFSRNSTRSSPRRCASCVQRTAPSERAVARLMASAIARPVWSDSRAASMTRVAERSTTRPCSQPRCYDTGTATAKGRRV